MRISLAYSAPMLETPTRSVDLASERAPDRLPPDFIIAGAMKAGTTTLRGLLARHPDVFVPELEPHFFSSDDIVERPDAFGPAGGGWFHHDFDRDFEANARRYRALFERARPGQLVGEHSPVYLASARAPARIARLLPAVKLIFTLRDPVERTYSHYWHRVRTGRTGHDFERTLRDAPHTLLTRSFYRAQLENYLRRFPRENIKVVVFEEYVRDVPAAMADISRFLGLRAPLDLQGVNTHYHRGEGLRLPRLQLLQNRLFRSATAAAQAMPGSAAQERPWLRFLLRLDAALRQANRAAGRYPAMRAPTRAFLQDVFARENAGLSDLIGIDLRRHWSYF